MSFEWVNIGISNLMYRLTMTSTILAEVNVDSGVRTDRI